MRSTYSVKGATPPRFALPPWGRLRRPLTFAGVGITSAATQLALLAEFEQRFGWHPLLANVVAFAIGAQVNLALHSIFTFRDRPITGLRDLAGRWGRFMGTVGSTALLNQLLFVVLLHWLPDLVASGTASLSISALNYAIGTRFIFTSSQKAQAHDQAVI
jgi:putative flippase GtrA